MPLVTAPPPAAPVAPERKSPERPVRAALRETIDKHGLWLDSSDAGGVRAEFSGKNLDAADLVDARLERAALNKASLKKADLTLADLRDASLVQANLSEANLLGTQFQQANLQAADFRGATGLVSPQLAGTNLFGALLPENVLPLEALALARRQAETAAWLTGLMLLVNALAWLRIFTTPDAQLLKNGSAVPYSTGQISLPSIPFIPFYLFTPVLIFCLYVAFHLSMQRLWDGLARLPAIFPDGRRLDAALPWFARWAPRRHFQWLQISQSPASFLEGALAILMLYWVPPVTLFLFWGRYLTLEDLRGTSLHALLFAAAVLAALQFPRLASLAFGAGRAQKTQQEAPQTPDLGRRILRSRATPPCAAGVLLAVLSVGVIGGVPHDDRSPETAGFFGARAWSAELLWTAGYNPFAQLTEADVSAKPQGWTGADTDLARVRGANLNRLRLRYIQGYGAFLAKARLWQADLRHAYLSEADLREANLRQADMRYAVLDHASLARTAMPEADLRGAKLDRANLEDANLSFVRISDASLLDATLDGANLYKADAHSSFLQRASLKKADLRESILEHADLTMANLAESYLVSSKLAEANLKQADLSNAILTEATLRKTNLAGAILRGAVLRGADLAGANLQGADLRGAEGASASQLCSAANLRDAQLDETLQQQVTLQCANLR